MSNDLPTKEITWAELYPALSPEQLEEARYYLTQYLELVSRIYKRTRGLTDSIPPPTMPMR